MRMVPTYHRTNGPPTTGVSLFTHNATASHVRPRPCAGIDVLVELARNQDVDGRDKPRP